MNVSSEIAFRPMYFRSVLQPAFRSAPQRMCLLYFFWQTPWPATSSSLELNELAGSQNAPILKHSWLGTKPYGEGTKTAVAGGIQVLHITPKSVNWTTGKFCNNCSDRQWRLQRLVRVFYMISFFSCLFLKYAPRKWQRSQQMSFSFLQLSILQLLLKSPIFLFLQSRSKADDFFVREVLDIDSHLLVSPLHLHLLELFVVSVKIVGYHSKGREK